MVRQETTQVIVVGAGFAGITAARELSKRGVDVVVLEARDRVGGRVWTQKHNGYWVDVGGQWTGPGQDHIRALGDEMGVKSFPTWPDGEHLQYSEGLGLRRHAGAAPDDDAETMGKLVQAIMAFDQLAQDVPLQAPWETPDAQRLDGMTVQTWIDENIDSERAREGMRTAIEAVFAAEPHEVSLLHGLFYAKSGNGFFNLISTEGGAQADRFDGGAGTVAELAAKGLGDAIWLSCPVRTITQDNGSITVSGDDFAVTGKICVVTVPPTLAGRIDYDPAMPPLRDQLTSRSPMGGVIKIHAIYDTPWWRDEGLSGRVVSDVGPIKVIFDNSPPEGTPGMLMGFIEGGDARRYAGVDEGERRKVALDCFVRYFGDRAAKPVDYIEGNWPAEQWSRGGYGAVFPAGTWVTCGQALREPVGRIHWAGTETAEAFVGYIDGAVRSGERVVNEVLEVLE
ncbi:MAG: flavin monoamine oxidase family protein [Chloroflexi bacterium]|nr:flavin monoamine oxidase family protein [Chloroflexota bacterium]